VRSRRLRYGLRCRCLCHSPACFIQRRTASPSSLPGARRLGWDRILHNDGALVPARCCETPRHRPVRAPSAVATLQRLGSSPAIPRPDPSGLPITQLQQLASFLSPKLVAQISYTELTRDGRLRQSVYLGLVHSAEMAGGLTGCDALANRAK
jgi:hypothetical protein